jgi:Co/Zn/Cd efflux system component
MAGCGCENDCNLEILKNRQKSTLVKVLLINAVMFIVIVIAALQARSISLFSDSLDNLGDAITYGLSLFVVSKSIQSKAYVALFKGVLILIGAILVVCQIFEKLSNPIVPTYEIMGIFGFLGILTNGICLWLLWHHRDEDINMSSVYECSRNDIASNLSVIFAAFLVWYFNSIWPDILIAALLSILLFKSSYKIISEAAIKLYS